MCAARALPLIFACLIAMMPALAHAQAWQRPVIFQREVIRIHTPAAPVILKEEEEEEEEPTPPQPKVIEFTVEVRSEDALRLDWIHTLQSLPNDGGVMIVFDYATDLPLIPSEVYTPLDVLFVEPSGRVLQVMPEAVLANIEEDIYASKPILAFLYLKGGICEQNGILPGSRIEHPAFNPGPKVLQ